MHKNTAAGRKTSKVRRQGGIALIEMVLVASILGLALLFHAASTVSGQQLMQAEGTHGSALQTMRAFLERMRTDPEYRTLYARITDVASNPRPAIGYPITDYYADFVVPEELGEAGILVEVPRGAAADDPTGELLVLREDMGATRFGLPFDLDGDGIVDDQPHDDDYMALPVVIQLTWRGHGDAPQTLRMSAWLRGPR